jgi:large subunit ribosomal protein L15e
MGAYKYIRESFQRAYHERTPEYRVRLANWRKQKVVERPAHPTNLVAARRLGYRARPDYLVARVRVKRGKRARRKARQGRKPGKDRKFVEPARGWQSVAEERARRKYHNFRVVGSYFAGEDGTARYFEVVLHNPSWPTRPAVRAPAPAAAKPAAAAPAAKR